MSKTSKSKRIYEPRQSYPDRSKLEETSFSALNVLIKSLNTAMLLLNSKEEPVLLTVFNHISTFSRRRDENIIELKENKFLELLLDKDLFMESENILIRRFALYITTALFENSDISEFETDRTRKILEVCYRFYAKEMDDFCIEYLTFIINMCLRDPQVAQEIITNTEFLTKFKGIFAASDNPDTVNDSIQAIQKMLQVQSGEEVLEFTTQDDFPIDRIICEMTNEFKQIREGALNVIKTLLADTCDGTVFEPQIRCLFVLQQLFKSFRDQFSTPEAIDVVQVLAIALRSEKITKLFFAENIFDAIMELINEKLEILPLDTYCTIISIFAEAAQYSQFLSRMHSAGVTDLFLNCLMDSEPVPSTSVLLGLNRLIAFPAALRRFCEHYDNGIISILLNVLQTPEALIKTKEQAAELLIHLLTLNFRVTSEQMTSLDIAEKLTTILQEGLPALSIDLILSLLVIIETLAQDEEYRTTICEHRPLSETIARLLMHSYSHSILVNNIFRCLCTIVPEEPVREELLNNFIVSSIKRALQSLSNLVKTAVTNFILQTTSFNDFLDAYIDRGILEVLMLNQKHAFCVSTWGPAIESILSKCPTMKFCIRNCLTFTDITAGKDFYISKQKFDDFRDFQDLLINDCSPMKAVFVVNFERPIADEEDLVVVPESYLQFDGEAGNEKWSYCKRPADSKLPIYLEALNQTLEIHGLVENPDRIRRSIDFDNVARRSKIVAEAVASVMSEDLKVLDLNTTEECSRHRVHCHLHELRFVYHTFFIPLGEVRSGCQFERAILFKCLADQIGLPSTLQRSVDGRMLYNEVPMPLEMERDPHCDRKTMKFMPWRMLRPTHIVDLMYNVGQLYPMQSRQALQYLRLY